MPLVVAFAIESVVWRGRQEVPTPVITDLTSRILCEEAPWRAWSERSYRASLWRWINPSFCSPQAGSFVCPRSTQGRVPSSSIVYCRLNTSTHCRQYRDLTTQYEGLDPSHGKRKRKAIAGRLRDILEEFEAKADQIYSLYDVVEGAGLNRMGDQSRRGWLELWDWDYAILFSRFKFLADQALPVYIIIFCILDGL